MGLVSTLIESGKQKQFSHHPSFSSWGQDTFTHVYCIARKAVYAPEPRRLRAAAIYVYLTHYLPAYFVWQGEISHICKISTHNMFKFMRGFFSSVQLYSTLSTVPLRGVFVSKPDGAIYRRVLHCRKMMRKQASLYLLRGPCYPS